MHLLQQVPASTSSSTRSAATRRAGSRAATRCSREVMSVFQPPAVRVIATAAHAGPPSAGAGRGRRRGRRRAVGGRLDPGRSADRPTTTSRSTSSTDRSAASRAGRCCAPVGGVLPPYWVFKALPSVCSDKLPGGYATFGFVIEARQGPAGWRLAAAPARHRSGRAQLRGVPHRHRARRAAGAAARSCSGCRRSSSICRRSCSSCSTARSTTG